MSVHRLVSPEGLSEEERRKWYSQKRVAHKRLLKTKEQELEKLKRRGLYEREPIEEEKRKKLMRLEFDVIYLRSNLEQLEKERSERYHFEKRRGMDNCVTYSPFHRSYTDREL